MRYMNLQFTDLLQSRHHSVVEGISPSPYGCTSPFDPAPAIFYRQIAHCWLGGTTGSASYQRSGGCGFEAY